MRQHLCLSHLKRVQSLLQLKITKDKVGLEQAKALQSFLNDVVAALEKEELPEKIERPAEQEVNNPFL